MRIHFIGIGGIGISGLAKYLHLEGHTISGSDIKESAITKNLKSLGIEITVPHSKNAINNQDIVVHSAIIKSTNEELIEAQNRGIKVYSRKEFLPFVLNDKKVFSVCGAHGKSTTTAILSAIFTDSSALIGAESKAISSNVKYSNSSNIMVFEADESDSSFLNSNPYCAIVTNAEPEHMEFYNYDLDKFYDAYREFLNLAKVRVINAEDEFLENLEIEAIRLYPSKDIKNIEYVLIDDEPYTRFELKDLGSFDVWGFGNHIAIDASLAILSANLEIDIEIIRERIRDFKGIKKRFDIVEKSISKVVIDDYAHHPTEIEVTLSSLLYYANLKGFDEVVTIWQPHKYSRTIDNLKRFIECFKGTKKLIILPVWSAGEEERYIDFENLFKSYNLILADKISKDDNYLRVLKDNKVIDLIENGLIIGFGAGDITYQLRGLC